MFKVDHLSLFNVVSSPKGFLSSIALARSSLNITSVSSLDLYQDLLEDLQYTFIIELESVN